MDERKIIFLAAAGSSVSLLILYAATMNIVSLHVNIGEIDGSFAGKTVNITGYVEGMREVNGNVFMTLKDETGDIKVVLWADTIEYLAMNGIYPENIDEKSKINLVGEVQVYRGELEIIPIRGNVNIL